MVAERYIRLNQRMEWHRCLERHDYGTASTGTFGAIAPAAAGQSEKAWKLGLGYKEGAIRAGLVYEKTSDDFAAASSKEHKAWTIGGGYLVNPSNEIKLAYTLAGDINDASDTGAKQWAVGIDHIMSKRTKLYAEYVKLTNEKSASYGLLGAGSSNTAGVTANAADADPSAFQFGVKHTF